MSMKHTALLVSWLTMVSLWAADGPGFGIALQKEQGTSVALVRPADYVVMSLTVESKHRDADERFAEIERARGLILSAARDQVGLQVHQGAISLSSKEMSKLAVMSALNYENPSTATFHVLARLDNKAGLFTCSTRIRRFVYSLRLPEETEFSLGQTQLAVADPEQYRADILRKIQEDVAFVRQALQAGDSMSLRVSLTGLESPVRVRQVDALRVALFIDYSMTVDMGAPARAAD